MSSLTQRDADVAWAAGIFEGEGCITKCGRSVQLRVKMTDRDVIERLHSIFPTTNKMYVENRDHLGQKPCFMWVVSRLDAVQEIMEQLAPWLCERRRGRALELGVL